VGTVEAVKAGERIRIKSTAGLSYRVETVAPACKNKETGHWYCVTHHEHFQNNLMKDFHIEGNGLHRLVWICHLHGAEQP